MGFSTSEAYFTILAVLVVLTAIGTFIGQWLSSKSTTDLAINRNRIINSRIRAAWGLIFVFAVAVYLGQGALVFIFAIASFLFLARVYRPDTNTAARSFDSYPSVLCCHSGSVYLGLAELLQPLYALYSGLSILSSAGSDGIE